MMRGLLIAALAVPMMAATLIAVGCGCGGADFDAGETEAAIFISDSRTGDPIADVIIRENGEELPMTCQEDANKPELCESQMIVLTPAVHEISIEAPGYKPATVTIDTRSMPSVHLAVELDAGE